MNCPQHQTREGFTWSKFGVLIAVGAVLCVARIAVVHTTRDAELHRLGQWSEAERDRTEQRCLEQNRALGFTGERLADPAPFE